MLVVICIFLSAYVCAELLSVPSSVSRGSSPEDSHGILYCDYCAPTHSISLMGGTVDLFTDSLVIDYQTTQNITEILSARQNANARY